MERTSLIIKGGIIWRKNASEFWVFSYLKNKDPKKNFYIISLGTRPSNRPTHQP